MSEKPPIDTPQPRFDVQRLYAREQSCKVPHAPDIFREEWKPDIQLEMNIKHEKLPNANYEVILRLNVTAKLTNRTAFILDVQQSGLFTIEHMNEEQVELVVSVHCPTILYPYARKTIADLIYTAGFPVVALAPINFEGLYYQRQQTKAEQTHKTEPNLSNEVSPKAETLTVN